MPIGVNLSSNAYPQAFYPTPQSPPCLRGGEVLALDKTGELNITSLQEFHVKLTPMGIAMPLPGYLYHY
ncbi:hypothetical protein LC653_18100 [Nostoc sp. CHAB 5784]|uniref:hypothetical protein n=1 Tax=Nostoc mirabile TaxID=2907820 RepID=UPI001E593E21|nr:hypothetical protein [Nostoc mirabile]MCC5665780.1 hypothetical protein [Nostoc mirabile CHAB5784]